jgi:hypothetical protein
MTENKQKRYREGLPNVPARIRALPVDDRGYPVPWFVAQIDGKYDFRVMDGAKLYEAIAGKICWVCGQKLGVSLAFTIGPMCALNRTIAEPPSHRECAEFSIKACPFLNQTEVKRNEKGIAEMVKEKDVRLSENGLKRQPGAICLWLTRHYRPFYAIPNDTTSELLFSLGKPDQVFWYCEGREATRAEVLSSIESGLPILREMAESEGFRAISDLERRMKDVMKLLPLDEGAKRPNLLASASRR